MLSSEVGDHKMHRVLSLGVVSASSVGATDAEGTHSDITPKRPPRAQMGIG